MRQLKLAEPQGQGEILRRVDIDERQEEVVPAIEGVEDHDRYQDGAAQRQEHVPPDAQRVGPVDARSLVELVRYRQEELAEEEDGEGAAIGAGPEPGRDDERQERIDPVQVA